MAYHTGLGLRGHGVVADLWPLCLHHLQPARHPCCLLHDVRKAAGTWAARELSSTGSRASARRDRSYGNAMKSAMGILLVLVATSSALRGQQQTAPPELTLQQAVAYALEHSPDLKSAIAEKTKR